MQVCGGAQPKHVLNRMKDTFKTILAAVAPSVLQEIRRFRRASLYRKQEAQLKRVLAAVTRNSGFVVKAGPFQGMKYVDHTSWSGLIPKLLGIYERELADVVKKLLGEHYDVIVNVGSAEGYYAIGFARDSARSKIIAYDIDPVSRELCRNMANLNGVADRVVIGEECTHATLSQVLLGRSLVICDCEGCELQLLDPEKCPALKQTDVLLELHEFVVPGLTQALLSKFRETHNIELIPAVAAGPEIAAGLDFMSLDDRLYAVSECRPVGMEWAVMTVRKPQTPP